MTDKELFTSRNFAFVSMHDGVVGSLYFFCKKEGETFRGRIRLNHEHGPQITCRGTSEGVWLLVTETGYDSYKRGSGEREERRSLINPKEIHGDLVTDPEAAISNAEGKIIYEVYSNGSHPSRGKLVRVKEGGCVTPLSQGNIDRILACIDGREDVESANGAVIEITAHSGMPGWMGQAKGKFGC